MARVSPGKYVDRLFSLDPAIAAHEIVAYRNRFFLKGSAKPATAPTLDPSEMANARRTAEGLLQRIRDQFWELPEDELYALLDRLDVASLPDLKISVARLSHVAKLREDFQWLATHKKTDPTLCDDMKRVVVMAPTAATAERERVLVRLGELTSVKNTHRMLFMMHSKFPQIYALDPSWFAEMFRVQATKPSRSLNDIPWWIWVLLFVLGALLRGSFRE